MFKTLYLAGPIFGRTDDECKAWRDTATNVLGNSFRILSPMTRDCRGMEESLHRDLVTLDLEDIDQSDVILANVASPSWGTAMEIFHAARTGRVVVGFGARPGEVSPWLRTHTLAIYATLEEACEAVKHHTILMSRL